MGAIAPVVPILTTALFIELKEEEKNKQKILITQIVDSNAEKRSGTDISHSTIKAILDVAQ